MKFYFKDLFIKGDEVTFYIYISLILIMILVTFLIGYKRLKKK